MASPSLGLSRSFSELVQGKVAAAREYNPYGIRVFLFFVFQLVLRGVTSFLIFRNPEQMRIIIRTDVLLSGMSFIVVFWPFIQFFGDVVRELVTSLLDVKL